MMRVPFRANFLWFLLVAGLTLPLQAADELRLYFIDVEGGQSTLMVAPSGDSLLVDTGFDGYGGRDAERIAAAAKDAGVKKINYLVITHFHGDHVGGVENLLKRMEVETFLDHGPSVESGDYPEAYAKAFAAAKHQVVTPGDTIPLKDLTVTVVAAAGKDIDRAGEPNPYCEGVESRAAATGENPQSVALVVEYGSFRFADLGDLTWDREMSMLCPANKVGQVDLYLTTHHGADSPQAIWGMAPRVAIQNNGPRKGGNATGWHTLMDSPGLEDVWQLHFAMAGGSQANAPDAQIANLRESGEGHHLKVTAREDGSFTVENPRNKFSRSYGPRPR